MSFSLESISVKLKNEIGAGDRDCRNTHDQQPAEEK